MYNCDLHGMHRMEKCPVCGMQGSLDKVFLMQRKQELTAEIDKIISELTELNKKINSLLA